MPDTARSHPPGAAVASRSVFPGRWFAALVLIGAALMDMIDITVVNVALPTIRRSLGASGTELEWVVSAYMLAFAAILIVAGSFGDRLGRKRLFVLGTAVFGLASLAAGLAHTPAQLIAARAVQGAAAGTMMPQLLATFRAIFPGAERGKAFGMYGAILGLSSALGLVLGGVLTAADLFGWSWRAVFFINVPIALLSLPAVALVVPETKDPAARRPDLVGAALLAAAIIAIAYPLLEGRGLGWPTWVWLLLAAGVVLLALLGIAEERRQHADVAPLLRTRLFRAPAFSVGLAVQLAFSAALQGFFLILAVWLQTGMGYSPVRAGLTALAFSLGSFLLAGASAPLALRYGRLVLIAGGLLLAGGFTAVDLGATHIHSGNPWPILPGLTLAGAGLSLLIIPLVNVVLAAVPRHAAGGASGVFTTTQQLGGALGVAIIGTVFFGRLEGHTFTGAFTHTLPIAVALSLVAAALAIALPRTAVADVDEEVTDAMHDASRG